MEHHQDVPAKEAPTLEASGDRAASNALPPELVLLDKASAALDRRTTELLKSTSRGRALGLELGLD